MVDDYNRLLSAAQAFSEQIAALEDDGKYLLATSKDSWLLK